MKPISTTWIVGKDAWGREVRLVHEVANGRPSWTIQSLAVSQRDEDSRIFGLSEETMLAMAEAVRGTKEKL